MKFFLTFLALSNFSNAADAGINAENLRQSIAYLSSEALEGRAPMSRGSKLAQEFILDRFKSYGLETRTEAVKKNFWGEEIGKNIFGVLKAGPECVYIEAHYDHWGRAGGQIQPGANDNASGAAMMLELARLLSAANPQRTVVFLASDYEEGAAIPMMGGLKGVSYHLKNPYCAKENIKAALIFDMLGGRFIEGAEPRLFLLGSESDEALHAGARELSRAAGFVQTLGIYAIEPAGEAVPRADYGPFRDNKIPFIFATSGIPPEYHTPRDTIDKIDFEFMRRAGAALFELSNFLASSAYRPAGKNAEPDWNLEAKTLGSIADQLTQIDIPESQAPYAAGVLKLADDLENNLPRLPKKERGCFARKTIQKAVLTLMEMNGSLKLWQHLVREH